LTAADSETTDVVSNEIKMILNTNSYLQSNDNEMFYVNPTVQPHYKYTQHQIDIEKKFESMGNITINRRAGEVDKPTFL
jgi:predicted adenine nucleotide alpha hydrolase (AANH) superfamily ATPase